jgi:C-terminal region of Mon2 protein/Domain of unknown function (DUF1981)
MFALPLLESGDHDRGGDDSIFLSIEMAKSASYHILASLVLLSTSQIEEELLGVILWSFNKFTVVLALLGLVPQRDAFLAAISKLCTPGSGIIQQDVNVNWVETTLLPQTTPSIANRLNVNNILSERNIQFAKTLIAILIEISSVIDSKAWFGALEALQVVDGLVASGKTGKRMESSPGLLEFQYVPQQVSRTRAMTFSPVTVVPTDRQMVPYAIYLKTMFENSEHLKLRALMELVRALCRLAHESAVSQTLLKDKSDEKSFAVTKILQVSISNLQRLLEPEFDPVWDFIFGSLIQLAHSNTVLSSVRIQVLLAFDEILVSAASVGKLKEFIVERKFLEPIRNIMALESQNEDANKLAWLPEIQKSALETLNKLLQTNGHNFSTAWTTTLDIIEAVAAQPSKKRVTAGASSSPETSQGNNLLSPTLVESPSSTYETQGSKASGVAKVAFTCIQLITTDFLTVLEPAVIAKCIATLSMYGSHPDDLNVSLTAVGLLWSICDFILTKRHSLKHEVCSIDKDTDKENRRTNAQDGKSEPSYSLDGLSLETGNAR